MVKYFKMQVFFVLFYIVYYKITPRLLLTMHFLVIIHCKFHTLI